MSQQPRTFNPNEHVMQIKSGQTSKDYLEVKWRIVWFRSVCPHGTIETEMLKLDLDMDTEEEAFAWNAEKRRSEKVIKHGKGIAIFRAVVKDGEGGIATGTKSEKAASFPDFIEKAETGAIGRALAALGYGTQFTGDEWEEAHRIVDSPVERQSSTTSSTTTERSSAAVNSENGTSNTVPGATEQQIASIRKLREHLGKNAPADEVINFNQAKGIIQQLTAEYRESKQNSKAS